MLFILVVICYQMLMLDITHLMICGSVIHILFCLNLAFGISLHKQVMCTEHLQERRELIRALHKDRKLSNLPKITQVGVDILFL